MFTLYDPVDKLSSLTPGALMVRLKSLQYNIHVYDCFFGKIVFHNNMSAQNVCFRFWLTLTLIARGSTLVVKI